MALSSPGSSTSSASSSSCSRPQQPPTPPPASILNTNKSVNSLFRRVWNLLLDMQNDPYPSCADLARLVVAYFVTHKSLFDVVKQSIIQTSLNEFRLKHPQRADLFLNTLNNSSLLNHSLQVSTELVPWCCKYFLKPLLAFEKRQYSNNTSM